ncbi:MAG: hypothetical protein KGS45_08080 [Planctomycetes bacterium]|nr:hypothetical protein [Planctomycetota bacterium]
MSDTPDLLVDLVRVPNGFEAETIAESLLARGIHARAFTAVGDTMQWEAGIKPSCLVQVPRSQLRAAQIALASIKSDSIDIDWDEMFGPEGDISASPAAPRKQSMVKVIGLSMLIGVGFIFVLGIAIAIIAIARHAILEPR